MKKMKISLTRKRVLMGYFFIFPWVIGFLGFYLLNLVKTVQFSLSTLNTVEGGGYYLVSAGLTNFRFALAESATYVRQLIESLNDIIIDVPLITFLSLFIALLLNRQFRGRTVIRAIFFLPVIMGSPAIVQALAINLRNVMGGVSNPSSQIAVNLLTDRAATGFDILALAETAVQFGFPIRIVGYITDAVSRVYDIIRMSGVQIIIFLASLQAIPPSLYEVAQIEGATSYETFWKITFPLVSPLLLTNVIYTIIDLYSQSQIVQVAHEMAFKNLNFGVSSAMSIINSLCIFIILGIVGFVIGRKVYYQS